MLYLAEVQKQKTGFMGGAGKAQIKLLAIQRTDQIWHPVPGEEVVLAEEANNLNSGTLVLADLNANRQVQRIQAAGRPLLGILQNLSRSLEKSKHQEEEIEQWKQSLTYQSQELNRRNMEMEARLEQLQQMEDDSKSLEAQRQEIENGWETVERLRKENERNTQELEGAWEHLRGEQRRLQEQHNKTQTAVLDETQTRQIQELLASLSSGIAPILTLREQLDLSFEMVATQQSFWSQHWQQLEQQRKTAQQQQEEVNRQAKLLHNSFFEWQQAQNSLEQASSDLQVKTSVLNSKQEYAQMLSHKLRNQEELYQQIYRLSKTADQVDISQKVDLEPLEKMPLDQLQQLVQDLQRDLQKHSTFVNDQEEELKFQQQHIEKLQAELSQANDNDRPKLEAELAEEQDCYQFLNETLVGQRQNIRGRTRILSQHQATLWQRQGQGVLGVKDDQDLDLESILVQIEAHRQQPAAELQKLEQQIEQMHSSIQQTQEMINNQALEQKIKQQELQSLEQNLMSLRVATAECWGRVNLYQEILPSQESVNGLRQQLEAIASTLDQVQQTGDCQLQTIAQMRQTLLGLMPIEPQTS